MGEPTPQPPIPSSSASTSADNAPATPSPATAASGDPALPPKGDWIQTFSGRHISPFHLTGEEIVIEDIAHALSHLCRFGGHAQRFYSVAQHSLVVSLCCPAEHALWGLLHDAAEAYLSDIPRPIKRHLPMYRETEDRLLRTIAERFALSWPMPGIVKEVDTAALGTEAQHLMGNIDDWADLRNVQPLVPAERLVPILDWTPAHAKQHFLDRFAALTSM
jgi:hypothetical protein